MRTYQKGWPRAYIENASMTRNSQGALPRSSVFSQYSTPRTHALEGHFLACYHQCARPSGSAPGEELRSNTHHIPQGAVCAAPETAPVMSARRCGLEHGSPDITPSVSLAGRSVTGASIRRDRHARLARHSQCVLNTLCKTRSAEKGADAMEPASSPVLREIRTGIVSTADR